LDEICNVEKLLNESYEAEILDKVKNYIKNDITDKEKMTPRFLRAAKAGSADSLSVIKDNNGADFLNAALRDEHIVRFYEELYKKPVGAPVHSEGAVREFLGPEIASHPLVTGSFLSEEERNGLETPITLEELDKSLAGSNMRSAPGIDGVSNLFIKKIWPLMRVPLLW